MPTVYSLYRARKQRDSVVFKCINISDINIGKIFVYVSSTTVQTRVQCNENSTRAYENLSVSKLVKTAISLGPVYEFVCDSFRTGNLNCFRVK